MRFVFRIISAGQTISKTLIIELAHIVQKYCDKGLQTDKSQVKKIVKREFREWEREREKGKPGAKKRTIVKVKEIDRPCSKRRAWGNNSSIAANIRERLKNEN